MTKCQIVGNLMPLLNWIKILGRSVVHIIIKHDKGLRKFICNQGNKASGIYLPEQVVENRSR